ncbi:hypothetical protein [Pararhodospirillum photometricum]|uniref:Uncharacterized protein n=1 Tax=Pararhodospirillum photometricum DSM 122 TaxID=1150469 RepID=H6SNY0_PARPM|nr:hypothetical protein [Pararhodospirillum photometricum]CCG07052.1 unnamed protein product [Pararhodospirillum photometricum DSM 122]
MEDGFAAAMDHVAQGKSRGLRLDLEPEGLQPSFLIGLTFGMLYADPLGILSRRWVTIRQLEGDPPEKFMTFCWHKHAARSFRFERVYDVFDTNGEVLAGRTFFGRYGLRIKIMDPYPAGPSPKAPSVDRVSVARRGRPYKNEVYVSP